MRLQVVTIAVSDLKRSRAFYEEVLGFEPDTAYGQWQSYTIEGGGSFGLIEEAQLSRNSDLDIVNFTVEDVEAYWEAVRAQVEEMEAAEWGRVEIELPLSTTPWGTYKFVIREPDGFRLGFVGPGT